MNYGPWLTPTRRLSYNSPAESDWELYRREFPNLQLARIPGDNRSMAFGRTRDHKVSLEYYLAFWTNISNKNAIEAARLLVQFLKGHRSTFQVSGWVKIAAARIVLEDAQAAREFVRSYWKEAQRPPAEKTMAAYEALCFVQGEHRKHWLAATAWMRRFYDKKHLPREADWRFVNRAVEEYRRAVMPHSCLEDKGLKAIAAVVVENPDIRQNELTDRALARLYRTSPSTLAHVRAGLGVSAPRPGDMQRPRKTTS